LAAWQNITIHKKESVIFRASVALKNLFIYKRFSMIQLTCHWTDSYRLNV